MGEESEAHWLTDKANCFVEFGVDDERRFQIFLKMFAVLRDITQGRSHLEFAVDERRNLVVVEVVPRIRLESPMVESYLSNRDWLSIFADPDLLYLGLPLHDEALNYLQKWKSTSFREKVAEANAAPSLQRLKDFSALTGDFEEITFEFVACELLSPNRARLEFFTPGYPYGGEWALEHLLLFFGFGEPLAYLY